MKNAYFCGLNGPHYCERCGDKLDETKAEWLHLSIDTGRYHDGELPAGEESQGWFAFGSACARAVLKNGGKCVHIKDRR